MVNGHVADHCDGSPYFSGHYILWLQSARGNLRAVDGYRRILWSLGGHPRSSLARVVPGFLLFCVLRTRCSVYYTWNVCLLGCWSRTQWHYAFNHFSDRYHVRADGSSDIHSSYYGETLPFIVLKQLLTSARLLWELQKLSVIDLATVASQTV